MQKIWFKSISPEVAGRLAGVLFLVLLVIGSLSPVPAIGLVRHTDKLVHLGSYGFITCWWLFFFRNWPRLIVVILMFCLGALLEYFQGLTGYRTFSLLDLAANGTGILLALCLRNYLFR